MSRADIEFAVNGKPVSFSVWHDLPEVSGLNIAAAVDNWLAREAWKDEPEFTAKSLCRYINSKRTGYTARPFNPKEKAG